MIELKLGEKIKGKYQIIEKLGEGASAKVYLAYNLIDEKNVALKVLKDIDITPSKLKAFYKEATAIKRLNHNNIIKIYEVDEDNGIHFIAQEYIDGITLKTYIQNQDKISLKEVVNIGKQILEGLDHAHENKVIHKDIKSQNILINVENEIKITDFGIADILEDDVTKTQSLMGTPQYVAPEILNKGFTTTQTDIYSTGILLYELLIGHAPFTGEKPTIIIMKQLNQPLPSLRQQRADIPQSLENIIIKATAKNLANRYQTAQEMIKDLNSCLFIEKAVIEKLELKDDLDSDTIATANLNTIKEIDKAEKSNKKNIFLIIGSLICIFLIMLTIFMVQAKNSTKTMPNFENKSYEETYATLNAYGIEKSQLTITHVIDDEIPENYIISTNPKAGELITKDSEIELVISNGKEKIKIENYLENPLSEIQPKLEEKGLIVDVFYEKSDKTKDTILKQIPDIGTELNPGDRVQLIVSEGKQQVKMINLLGMLEKEVETWIDENNLNLSKSYKCNDIYKKNQITSQTPKYNTLVEENSQIKVIISTGSCPQNNKEEENTNQEITTDSTDKNE